MVLVWSFPGSCLYCIRCGIPCFSALSGESNMPEHLMIEVSSCECSFLALSDQMELLGILMPGNGRCIRHVLTSIKLNLPS